MGGRGEGQLGDVRILPGSLLELLPSPESLSLLSFSSSSATAVGLIAASACSLCSSARKGRPVSRTKPHPTPPPKMHAQVTLSYLWTHLQTFTPKEEPELIQKSVWESADYPKASFYRKRLLLGPLRKWGCIKWKAIVWKYSWSQERWGKRVHGCSVISGGEISKPWGPVVPWTWIEGRATQIRRKNSLWNNVIVTGRMEDKCFSCLQSPDPRRILWNLSE